MRNVLTFLLLGIISPINFVFGQVYWDGGSTGAGTSWSSAQNWAGDSLPSVGANVIFNDRNGTGFIPSPMSISGNRTLGLITFDNINSKLPTTLNIDTNGTGGTTARTLTINSGITLSNTTTSVVFNGTKNGTLSIALGGNSNITVSSSATLTLAPAISGAFNVSKFGLGTLVLSAANSYTGGTNINGGTLAISNAAALGTTGTISFGGGTLRYDSLTTDLSSRFSNTASQQYSVDTNSNDVTFASNLTSSGGSLTKLGSGILTLSGTNTYTGTTTVNGGKLVVASGGAISNTSQFIVQVGDAEINGSLSAGSITLNGGTLGGSGTITTTGALTLNGGAIIGNANITAASTTIGNGATIGGNRTVGGNLTVSSGGILAPGNSPGTLTVNGDFLMDGNYDWEVDPIASQTADLTVVNGNLTWGASAFFNLIPFNGGIAPGQTYTLFAYTGTFTGSIGPLSGYTFTTASTTSGLNAAGYGSGYKFLNITAVPEPSCVCLVGLLSGLGLTFRRGRRNSIAA